jgi:hypothetical protein
MGRRNGSGLTAELTANEPLNCDPAKETIQNTPPQLAIQPNIRRRRMKRSDWGSLHGAIERQYAALPPDHPRRLPSLATLQFMRGAE